MLEGSGTAVTLLVPPKLKLEAVETAPDSVTVWESEYVPELLADTKAGGVPDPGPVAWLTVAAPIPDVSGGLL